MVAGGDLQLAMACIEAGGALKRAVLGLGPFAACGRAEYEQHSEMRQSRGLHRARPDNLASLAALHDAQRCSQFDIISIDGNVAGGAACCRAGSSRSRQPMRMVEAFPQGRAVT